MGKSAKTGFACMVGLLAAGAVSIAPVIARGEAPIPVGTKAGQMHPDFLLPRTDGTFGRLSDYRGKKVLLIHFASW